MRELLTKLAISRRSAADAKLVTHFKKRDALSWQHIDAVVKQRLTTWWREWQEDDDDQQQQQEDGDGDEEKAEQQDEENEADSRPLPGQNHDYTGPDFATFALACPLPATFTFFSLSLHQRVVLLRCFCDDQLAFAADFAATVRGVEARDARIPPLGSDSWGHRYFFFGFPDWRIYREDNAKPIKPRELKKDRVKRQQAEVGRGRAGKEENEGQEDSADSDDEEEEEEEERKESAAASKVNGRNGKVEAKGKVEESPSEPSSSRSASTAPRFQLLSSSPDTLLALVTSMRKSAYSKDKALSKQLLTIYDDLQQGRGRQDNDEQDETEGAEDGEEPSRKRPRKKYGSDEAPKRSMRLVLVMAEKEEQERQQRLQAEERRKMVEQAKDNSIASLVDAYFRRHDQRRKKSNKRS